MPRTAQEKAALSQSLRAQLAEAAAEADSLRRLLRLRTHELARLRQLAQEALLQRSDVEAFLIASIQQVRREADAEALSGANGGGAQGGDSQATRNATKAGASSGEDAATGGRSKGSGVDVSQLSWAERERVLRLLFARVNGHAAGMAGAAPLPQHSLAE